MSKSLPHRFFWRSLLMTTLVALIAPIGHAADILFDNLGNESPGVDTTTETDWNAQSFRTLGTEYLLDSVTLSISRTGTGNAAVEVWSGTETIPVSFLHSLVLSGSYSETPAQTTFTSTGYALATNSTFWIVLRSLDANTTFGWSFTPSESGTGDGFTTNWSNSLESGSNWTAYDFDPLKMRVSVSTVPEPSACILACIAAAAAATFARRHKARIA